MTIQEQLRALWGNVDSEGPHTGSDDFRNGFMAAVGVITDKLEAAGFAWNASTAADEIDRLRSALDKIANGEGYYGAQAYEYKQIAHRALDLGSPDDAARDAVEHQKVAAE